MQRSISEDLHVGQTVDPSEYKFKSDRYCDQPWYNKWKNNKLLNDRIMCRDVTKYVQDMEPISYQGMIYYAETKEKIADWAYKDLQTLEFNIELPANQYIYPNSFHICLLIEI